jgi:Domain of unknown function (DUF4070)
LNFVPVMDARKLIEGYKKIIGHIYEPREYYERVLEFLSHYRPRIKSRLHFSDLIAFSNSIIKQGILGKERWAYWPFLVKAYHRNSAAFSEAVTLAIMGYHFRKVSKIELGYQ